MEPQPSQSWGGSFDLASRLKLYLRFVTSFVSSDVFCAHTSSDCCWTIAGRGWSGLDGLDFSAGPPTSPISPLSSPQRARCTSWHKLGRSPQHGQRLFLEAASTGRTKSSSSVTALETWPPALDRFGVADSKFKNWWLNVSTWVNPLVLPTVAPWLMLCLWAKSCYTLNRRLICDVSMFSFFYPHFFFFCGELGSIWVVSRTGTASSPNALADFSCSCKSMWRMVLHTAWLTPQTCEWPVFMNWGP